MATAWGLGFHTFTRVVGRGLVPRADICARQLSGRRGGFWVRKNDRPVLGTGRSLGPPWGGPASEGGGLLEDGRLAVRRLVGVDDALADGLVEEAAGLAGGLVGLLGLAGLDGLVEATNSRFEGRLHGLVAKSRSLVLAVALDLGLDVRHGAEPRSEVCGQYRMVLRRTAEHHPWAREEPDYQQAPASSKLAPPPEER